MDLTALQKHLLSILSGTSLEISPADENLPEALRALAKDSPQGKLIWHAITAEDIRVEDNVLSASGTCGAQWPVQGMPDSAVLTSTLTLEVAASPETVSVTAHGKMPLPGNQQGEVVIHAPKDRELPWELRIKSASEQILPRAMIALGRGQLPFSFPIPPSLEVFELPLDLVSDRSHISFEPQRDGPAHMIAVLEAPQFSWVIIQDFLEVQGLDLTISTRKTALALMLEAQIEIANIGMKLGIQVLNRPVWSAWIRPAESDRFPGIVALAARLSGAKDIAQGFENLDFDIANFDLAISKVSLSANPFEAKLVSLEVQSVLSLKNIDFDLVLQLPSRVFHGSLRKETPIVVRSFLAEYGIEADFIPAELKITEIDLQAQLLIGRYALAIAVERVLKIGPLELDAVRMQVQYAQGKGFSGRLDCQITLAEVVLSISAGYSTEQGWFFAGRAFSEGGLNLGKILTDISNRLGGAQPPEILHQLSLKDIGLGFQTKDKRIDFRFLGELQLGKAKLEACLTAEAHDAEGKYEIKLGGELKIGRAELALELKTGSTTTLKATGKDIDFQEIVSLLAPDLKLPPELPSLILEEFSFEYSPSAGTFDLSTTITSEWEKPLGLEGKVDTKFTLKASRGTEEEGRPVKLKVGFEFNGPLKAVDTVELEKAALNFSWEKGKSWSLGGSIRVKIFDEAFALEGSYEDGEEGKIVTLRAKIGEEGRDLLNIPGALKVKASTFSMRLQRKQTKTLWELEAKSGLRLAEAVDLSGTLKVYRKEQEVGLEIIPDPNSFIELPLVPEPLIKPSIRLRITAPTLKIFGKSNEWKLTASSKLSLPGLPRNSFVTAILPQEVTVELTIDQNGVILELDKLTERLPIKFPNITIGDVTIPFEKLGTTHAQLRGLRLQLGKECELAMSLYIGLPDKINEIFGTENGKPSVRIFNTFDPEKPDETSVQIRFGLGYDRVTRKTGVIFKLDSSPFAALKIENNVWKCDLGHFGAVDIQIPTFSFDGTRFNTSVKFDVDKNRPLQLSLKPIKNALIRSGAETLAKALPDSWPLMEIIVFNPKTNKIEVQDFFDKLNELLKIAKLPPLLGTIKQLIERLAKKANRLPDAFKEYLNFKIPHSFAMSIGLSGDGGVDVNVEVDGDRPIRLLLPAMVGPMPVLQGYTIKGFSVGTILAGSLFTCGINVVIDQFDLPSLAAAVFIPENDFLPDPNEFHRRLIIEELFMLIIYQAGFPIPVPIFCKHLAIQNLGIEGLKAEAHLEFKKPSPDLGEAVSMFNDFRLFVTDKTHRLKEEELPTNLNLRFKLWDIYLQLPQYLGGQVIGKKGSIVDLDLLKMIAQLMNGIKFFSVNDLIGTIELDDRVGNERVTFFDLGFEAQWLLTTPKEFREGAYKRLGTPQDPVAPTRVKQFMELVPAYGDSEGFIAFLRGRMDIAGGDIGRLEAAFGMAITQKGFATSLFLEGFLRDVIHMKLQGALLFNTDPLQFRIEGQALLTVAKIEVFEAKGLIEVKPGQVNLSGDFYLFKSLPFQIHGYIKGDFSEKGVLLEGEISARLGPVPLAGLFLRLIAHSDHEIRGLWIRGHFLGAEVNFEAVDSGERFDMVFNASLPQLAEIKGVLHLDKEKDQMYSKVTAGIAGFGDLVFEASVSGTQADFTLTYLGLSIGTGTGTSVPPAGYRLDGRFQLFPKTPPFNILGSLKGDFEKDTFDLKGTIRAVTILPGVLGGSDLHIQKTGVTFGLVFLGRTVAAVKVVDHNGKIRLAFSLELIPGSVLEPTFDIDKNGQGGSCHLLLSVLNDLKLDARLSLGAASSGNFSVRMLGHHLIGGTISLAGEQFSLNGKIDFGPLQMGIKGRIGPGKFYLHGKTEFGIPGITIGAEFTVDNGLPRIGMWIPLISVGAGLRMFRGQVCFMYTGWIDFIVRTYVFGAFGPNGIVVFPSAASQLPSDWPRDLKTVETPEPSLGQSPPTWAQIAEKFFPNVTPLPLTETLHQMFTFDWSGQMGMPEKPIIDQQRVHMTQFRYAISGTRSADPGEEQLATITLQHTYAGNDFFSELTQKVNQLLDPESSSLIDLASIRLKLTSNPKRWPQTAWSMNFRSKGEDLVAAGEADLSTWEPIYTGLADAIRKGKG